MGSGIKDRFIKVRISNNSDKSFMHSWLCNSRKREEELFRQELEANDPFVQKGDQTAVRVWHGY